ncbi:MAG: HEAT repeat domain-containing protein [Myxococcota bacterium]|mgnify:CR=1 FL=1
MFVRPKIARSLVAAASLALAACAPATYSIRNPAPSGLAYEIPSAPAEAAVSVLDERPAEEAFSRGVLPAGITVDGAPIDPPAFLASGLEQELRSRGLPTRAVVGGQDLPRVHLRSFHILNHRVNAYSPFVTLTLLSADIETSTGTRRVGVFVKRGKIPVWSFNEVIEPIFSDPLSLLVKEFSAKFATVTYGYRSSDATVREIVERLARRDARSFLDVYALGFTNNPTAIPKVVELLDDADEYVRLAAISSLGTLGAKSEFGRLKALYEGGAGLWQDRAMAAKAIGDLDTEEGRAWLAAELERIDDAPVSNDTMWTSQIIRLYLDL